VASKEYYLKNPWYGSFLNARARCNYKNCKDYPDYGGRGIKFLLSLKEIKELWFRDKAYLMKQHSINRKDNNGDYTFENCEFIEMGINSCERNIRVCSKTILQFDKQGNFIREWPSATLAARTLNFNQGNIHRVIIGKTNSAYGYIWRYK